jgi:hypothetical protein
LSKLLYAIIKSGHSSLQKIGSNFSDSIDLESRIKKSKRWLDSKYTDFESFFLPHVELLLIKLAAKGELLIIMDGSEVGDGCTALMVSVAWRKRSLPICWVIKKCKKGHLPVSAHLEVLQTVLKLLPDNCQPILLGDGEFDSCAIQQFCQDNNWLYVLRTAKNTLIETQTGDKFTIGGLYPMENHQYRFVEDVYFTKKRFGVINCLVWHSPQYQHPLYLVTNIEWAKPVMDYYKKRFSIETIFGDIKSRGFNIHRVKISNPERIDKLLMVVCIAFLLVFALGTFKKQLNPFMPKFVRKDRINQLSVFQLGLRAIQYFIKEAINLFPEFSNDYFKNFSVR